MNIAELKLQLTRDEGKRKYVYQDSEGFWTIGVGHLVDIRLGGQLSNKIIDAILEEDITSTVTALDAELSWWTTLDEARQTALANMCFNLGIKRLLGFEKFLAALKRKDFNRAAVEMLDSKWAQQVGARAARLANVIKGV